MTENNAEPKKEKCESIENNSEILFIYDAKMCNPNGDPDDENKPRMDYDRNINLVSDLRLKRYIRDYLMAVLADHGYLTHGVDEKESILEAVTKLRPDLIILDIMMPERSGLSVYKVLRTTPETADIPIALLTGVTSDL